jgi:hypothetical protein
MGLLDRFIYLSFGLSVIRVFIGGRLIVTFLHQLDPANAARACLSRCR